MSFIFMCFTNLQIRSVFKDEMERCCWNEEDVKGVSKQILTDLLGIFCSKAEQVFFRLVKLYYL